MDEETDKLIDECETSWDKGKALTIPNVVLDDAPLKELIIKAHNILASESHETLDALVCRLADSIPEGVTEENFPAAKPLAGACKKWFSNVEKLRSGLKRPALDWGKAVDTAAKEWVARAAPTLNPIIDAVKKIDDRKKAEKAAAEAAEVKRIEDERLTAEKARRDMIEAEQTAERARLKAEQDVERARIAAAAEANRIEAEKIANDRREIEEMKRWLAEREAAIASQKRKSDIADEAKEVEEETPKWPPSAILPDPFPRDPDIVDDGWPPEADKWPMRNDPIDIELAASSPINPFMAGGKWPPPSAKLTNEELQSIMLDAETSAEFSKSGVEVCQSGDTEKVRDLGNAIMAFKNSIKRPLVIRREAQQEVELALFDLCEIAKRLQEWSMS